MVSIFSDSWIDLVFEGRNQQYGAFELRKQTPRNSIVAGFISLSLLAAAIIIPIAISLLIGHHPPIILIPRDDSHVVTIDPIIDVPVPVAPKLPPPPPPPAHAAAANPIVVAPDIDVIISQLPPQDNINNNNTNNKSQPDGLANPGIPSPAEGIPAPIDPPVNPFIVVEVMPVFPGGESALLRYVAENTHYPDFAKENGIEGTVYVQFVVDAKGYVTDVKVLHSVDKFLDREALRVIASLPKWTPGRQNGKEVPVQWVLPIRFQIK